MGTELRAPDTSVAYDHNPGIVPVVFWSAVAERGFVTQANFNWPTSTGSLPEDLEVLASVARHGGTMEAALDLGDAGILRVQIESGNVFGTIAAVSRDQAETILTMAEEWWPKSVAAEDEVPMTFWSYSQHGPRSINRRITVPTWEQVAGNYAGASGRGLHRMMTDFRPSHGGQLILWQGIPGTGKTWALRALASEWRGWADFHYITDPEIFFGSKADYMLDVLLDDPDEFPGFDELGPKEPRWRVLLLEDTGEILAADAKEKTGQALSRLLNVVDGLIGQGLHILVLVTTNEELKKLHPAVSRPGRCAARIEFEKLPGGVAQTWLSERGVDHPAGGPKTLAELYATADDRVSHDDVPVGFVQ